MRLTVIVGFGLIFAVWLIAAVYFGRRIADVESRAAVINGRYVQAQTLLSNVRSQILLGSVYVRDALLDPDPTTTPQYRRRLEETSGAVDEALRRYVPVLDSPDERDRVARLRREITDFHQTMLRVLDLDVTSRPPDARVLLQTRVMPKRELVIRVSDEVQALNRGAFVRQQSDVAAVYAATERRIWATVGVALVASFGIGLLATAYAGRLEDRLRGQRARDVETARDLQHLSARLITAQEEERRTIARELHDEVGQVLTAIKVELGVAQHRIDASGGPAHLLDDSRSIVEGALAAVRDLSHLLHPALLDDLGLPAAVEWYLRGFGKRHGIRVEVVHEGMDDRFTPDVEASVYRIVQEALTNVAKHAAATACRVYLRRRGDTIFVAVEDDGIGFDAGEPQRTGERRGLGLVGIRERVAQLRGTMQVESAPGHGTRITVALPARTRTARDPAPAAVERG